MQYNSPFPPNSDCFNITTIIYKQSSLNSIPMPFLAQVQTFEYLPPDETLSCASDVWALAMCVLEIQKQATPLTALDVTALHYGYRHNLQDLVEHVHNMVLAIVEQLNPAVRKIMACAVAINPGDRPPALTVYETFLSALQDRSDKHRVFFDSYIEPFVPRQPATEKVPAYATRDFVEAGDTKALDDILTLLSPYLDK